MSEKSIKLAPSILSADFSRLGQDVESIREAEYVHVDVMDGQFVPNISFGAPVLSSIKSLIKNQVADVHMMVEEPARFTEDFSKAGADIFTVHAEAVKHLDRTLDAIHDAGMKAGIALNPATPVSAVEYAAQKADMILLMSVNPGFGGQKYIPYITEKVYDLKELLEKKGLYRRIDIEVDGGINTDNCSEVVKAGANVIVAGSAVFSGDPAANVRKFHQLFQSL